MRFIARKMREFLLDQAGPTSVEYAVLLALILVVIVASVSMLGSKVNSSISGSSTALFG